MNTNRRVGQYYYIIRGRFFRIYRYTQVSVSGGYAGSPVDIEPLYPSREQARQRVYQLNGWKYTSVI